MIEIIPNWHPIFVHFTLALVTTSVAFYGAFYLTSFSSKIPQLLTYEFEIVARWCLWIGALITIATILAGLYAFDTVHHDEISHRAMHTHRNWALSTASALFVMVAWSFWRYRHRQQITLIFIISLLIVEGALLSTAWRGSELVYRYGLGVMSLPKIEKEAHSHHHHHEEE